MLDLRGKVALITGAARGLGLLMAEDLAKEGMRIAGTDLRHEILEHEMNRVSARFGTQTMAVTADVGDEEQVIQMVSRVYKEWGQIDVLINNAGIRQVAPIWETSSEMWDLMHDSNLKGQFLCTREVLKQGMKERNEGTILCISSGSGKQGEENSAAYCASKWGVLGFSESIAKDLKDSQIRVTAMTPGMIWTPMAEESEVGHLDLDWLDPRWVSQAAVFCIKQDADTIIPELRIYHRSQL